MQVGHVLERTPNYEQHHCFGIRMNAQLQQKPPAPLTQQLNDSDQISATRAPRFSSAQHKRTRTRADDDPEFASRSGTTRVEEWSQPPPPRARCLCFLQSVFALMSLCRACCTLAAPPPTSPLGLSIRHQSPSAQPPPTPLHSGGHQNI